MFLLSRASHFSFLRAVLLLCLLPLASATRAADTTPPVDGSVSFTPTGTYAANAAPTITITANATDNVGLFSVVATIYENGKLADYKTLTSTGGNAYSGTYNIGAYGSNNGDTPSVYTVSVTAGDNAGNKTTKDASGSITVKNDNVAPSVTNASITPVGTYAANAAPKITVTATVTDTGGNNTGVQYVHAYLLVNGSEYTYFDLTNGGSGSVYTGTYNLANFGPNATAASRVYTVRVYGYDNVKNVGSALASGSVTVKNDNKGPSLGSATVSPQIVGNGGAKTVILKAIASETGSSDTGVDYIDAYVYKDGQYRDYVSLDTVSGTMYFNSRPYVIPVGDANPHFWTFTIRATDNVGNRTTINRYAAQAGTATQPVPTLAKISPTSALSHSSVTITLTGTNFTASSVVLFDGFVVPVTFNSATSLTAAVDSSFLPGPKTVSVQVYNPAPGGGTTSAQTFTINSSLSSVSLSPATVAGGASSVGTVTLEAAANGDQTVTLASSNVAATVPASVIVPAGQKTATFAVTTTSVTSSTKVTITGKLGVSKTATLTINPSTTVTFMPTGDATVTDGASADTNYGASTTLSLRRDTADGTGKNSDTYLTFAVTGFASVTSAHLKVYAALSSTSSASVATKVYAVPGAGWDESAVTWNTRPALGALVGTTTVSGTTYAVYDVDVTAYVSGLSASGGTRTVSLALHNPSASGAIIRVNSKENTANKPQLIITGN